MATFGETLRTALTTTPAVTAMVSGRIFPNYVKQGVTFPAIRYFVIDDIPSNTLDGFSLRRGMVQVDAFAKTYLQAQALADAIEGALLTNFRGPAVACWIIARRDWYEEATEVHHVSIDVSMSMDVSGT